MCDYDKDASIVYGQLMKLCFRPSLQYPQYETYYCENRLYIVRRKGDGGVIVRLVAAGNPDEAIKKVVDDSVTALSDVLKELNECDLDALAGEHGTESGEDPQFDRLHCICSNIKLRIKGKAD